MGLLDELVPPACGNTLLLREKLLKVNDGRLQDVGSRFADRKILASRCPATVRRHIVRRTPRPALLQGRNIARDTHDLGADARQLRLPVLFLVSLA